jgi:hypothetical protein
LIRRAALALLVALAAAGCGGDSKEKPEDVSKFIGNWQVSSGAMMVMCQGIQIPEVKLEGRMVTVAAGTDAPLEVVPVQGCTLKFKAKGGEATALPDQSCMTTIVVFGTEIPAKLTADSATLTLTDAGGANLVQRGTASGMSPIPFNCVYTLMASGMKAMP